MKNNSQNEERSGKSTATGCTSQLFKYLIISFLPSGTNTYTVTGTNAATNCQSTATTTIGVNTVVTSVNQNSNILTANANSASYQWLDCNNGFLLVPGAVNKNFTVPKSGSYALVVTQNNCTDTSACYAVIISGTDDYLSSAPRMAIYPNPFSEEAVLRSGTPFNNAILTIYNLEGQIVKEITNVSGQSITFHRGNLASGMYCIRLEEKNKISSAYKLIIVD